MQLGLQSLQQIVTKHRKGPQKVVMDLRQSCNLDIILVNLDQDPRKKHKQLINGRTDYLGWFKNWINILQEVHFACSYAQKLSKNDKNIYKNWNIFKQKKSERLLAFKIDFGHFLTTCLKVSESQMKQYFYPTHFCWPFSSKLSYRGHVNLKSTLRHGLLNRLG